MQTLLYLICILSGVIVGSFFGFNVAIHKVTRVVVDASNTFIRTMAEVNKNGRRTEKTESADGRKAD